MISKITKLSGIGTLHSPLINGALILKAKTIIYGENGRGKTTLVSVLRSLASGDTNGLRGRKTINGTMSQAAQILIGTRPHDLTADVWSKTFPEISIFDSTFINENVYSGAGIDPEHRKNLLSFAIGTQGVNLAKRVDELAVEISKTRSEESALQAKLKVFISGNLAPEQFINLEPANEDAQEALKRAKSQRDAIARASTISSLESPSPISFDGVDQQNLLILLGRSLETVSADIAERVREHVEIAKVTESWLEEGSRFESGDSCPYCAQDTRNVLLVDAIRANFGDAYRDFKKSLEEQFRSIADVVSAERLASIKSIVDGNKTKLIAWKEYISSVELSFDLKAHIATLRSVRESLQAISERKLASPLDVIELLPDEQKLLRDQELTVTAIDDYNASQVEINERIASLKKSVSTGNLSSAQAAVDEIENRISRGSTKADAAAKELQKTIEARKRLEREKEASREALDAHMATVVGKYKDRINEHLKGCQATFRIKELKTVYTGAKPRFDYAIDLFGVPVNLANKPGSAIGFDSALSYGDKGALAFAFFLAKLENDPNLSKQIVIFDDPLSSLDSRRRLYTRKQIAKLASDVAQVIVLTHEEATVADLAERLRESECAIYKLKAQGDFSVFTATCVKELTASEYVKCFDAMTHYLHGDGKPENVVKKVRPYLEMNLRFRFPEEFGPTDSLGDMIGRIRTSSGSKPLARMNAILSELEEINEYATDHSHGDGALKTTEKMLDSDLRNIVERAIKIGRGLPI